MDPWREQTHLPARDKIVRLARALAPILEGSILVVRLSIARHRWAALKFKADGRRIPICRGEVGGSHKAGAVKLDDSKPVFVFASWGFKRSQRFFRTAAAFWAGLGLFSGMAFGRGAFFRKKVRLITPWGQAPLLTLH